MLALHAGHRVDVGRLLALVRPPAQVGVVREHHAYGDGKHDDGHQQRAGVLGVQPVGLLFDIGLVGHAGGVADLGVVGLDAAQHLVVGHDHRLAHPDQADQQHQRQQRDPHHHRASEPLFPVVAQYGAEEQEAHDAPHHEQEIGLGLHRAVGDQVRQQYVQAEGDHQPQADQAGPLLHLVPAVLRRLVGRGRHEAVDQRGADGGDVHDPADGRAAHEGHHRRHRRDQHHGVGGHAMFVELGDLLGQYAVQALGVEQAAQAGGVADEGGQYQCHQRRHQYPHAALAQVVVGGVEGRHGLDARQVAPIPDVFQPGAVAVRVGGDGQQRDQGVQQPRGDQRRHHHPEDLPVGEGELLGAVGDALEADEGPGADDRDLDDLSQDAGVGNSAGLEGYLQTEHRRDEHGDDSPTEHADQAGHQPHGQLVAVGAQIGRGQDHRDGDHGLAEVDVIAEYGVHLPDLKHPAQEVAGEQGDRRGVGPQHRQVGQRQKPAGQKAVVVAEDLAAVGIGAAGVGKDLHHVTVVPADEQHDQRAQHDAQYAAHRSGLPEIAVRRHHQRAPAHRRAQRERPGVEGRQPRAQPGLIVGLHRHTPFERIDNAQTIPHLPYCIVSCQAGDCP